MKISSLVYLQQSLKFSIILILIFNCNCFFSCMTTARVQPKGSSSVGFYYSRTIEREENSFDVPVLYIGSSIAENKELGCSFGFEPAMLLFDYKYQTVKETKWQPAFASDFTAGLFGPIPWISNRFITSKKIFFSEPYVVLELGFPYYIMGAVGLKIPGSTQFALYFEFDNWYREVAAEAFPEGPHGHDNSLAIGLECSFIAK